MAITSDKDHTNIGSGGGGDGRPPMRREDYLSLRRRYEPGAVSLVIVAESPPQSGLYFYNPGGVVSEPLFAALMKVLGLSPKTKACGLRALQQRGWVLVDATYEPVDKVSDSRCDTVIVRDYPLLRDDLARLTPDLSVPVILIKANVCRLLEHRLTADSFNVVNRGRSIPFPSHGWQNQFQRVFGATLKAAGVST